MRLREWFNDIVLGVRLSVGGGRTSWARLALSAFGIGIATAVLLVAASVGTMSDNRAARQAAPLANVDPIAGVDPTYVNSQGTQFHDQYVDVTYVAATGPDSRGPVGMPTLPKPGEMYASPALAEVLGSEEGKLLRPRFPEKVIGILDQSLVRLPADLIAWVGVDEKTVTAATNTMKAYSFGADPSPNEFPTALLVPMVIGAVIVLLPVFIFVSSASRIAGAERDRRLAALRLVGSGARQVRRIAAAESLVGAAVGMVLGTIVFLAGRQFAESITLFDEAVFVDDVVPSPGLVVFIVVLIPALTVVTALVALRRTIIEPLGVVRHTRPVRRRAWWRFALIVLGVVALVTQFGFEEHSDEWAWAISGGAALLLIGVPVLLPWLVERVAGRLSGGPSSWLLAVRRLQLDSGTSARVVGGVAVVLAGAIALQTVLLSVEGHIGVPGTDNDLAPGGVDVVASSAFSSGIERDLAAADGVTSAHQVRNALGFESEASQFSIAVLSCAALRDLAGIRDCQDGDIFGAKSSYQLVPASGTRLEWRQYPENTVDEEYDPTDFEVTGTWTVPADLKPVTLPANGALYAGVLATPGALDVSALPIERDVRVVAMVDRDLSSDQLEGIRNVVADRRLYAYVYSYNTGPDLTSDQQTFISIRNTLYAGSIFTLMLAAISLLVLALEHIRERRRQLAVLSASGVPRGVLGRSLLWQVALPIGLGVVVALVIGIGLAALVLRLTHERFVVDWGGVALLSAGAIALSLLVSAMTMPFLRNAMRLTALRTE